jgi:hypothetical protein
MTTVILAIKKSIISNHPKKDSSRALKHANGQRIFSCCTKISFLCDDYLSKRHKQQWQSKKKNKKENKYEENLVLHDIYENTLLNAFSQSPLS